MKLLALDLEIGNPFEEEDGSRRKEENTWLTEVGLALYDTEMGHAPVDVYSALVNEGKGVSEEAAEYTKISPELVLKYGKEPLLVAGTIMQYLKDCDYVVAQNGERADKPWLKNFLMRILGAEALKGFKPPHWIDTLTDVEYPKDCRAKNLMYLDGYHGFVNPFPHRALLDAMSMMKVLFNYDLERVIAVSKSEKVLLKALSIVDMYPGKKKAAFIAGTPEYKEMDKWKKKVKKAGYLWDGDAENTGQKCWWKSSRKLWIDEGKEKVDFETTILT